MVIHAFAVYMAANLGDPKRLLGKSVQRWGVVGDRGGVLFNQTIGRINELGLAEWRAVVLEILVR